jgi:epoxyqueuosine reductase
MVKLSDPASALEGAIKAQALGLGFDLAGITRLGQVETAGHYQRWVEHGHAGEMEYMRRNADLRADSRRPFEGVTSAIVVGLDYGGREAPGPVARYARGDDYHELMWRRLEKLHDWIRDREGRDIRGRAFVDTGPILERDLARRAGLGWFGKNTTLINPDRGSFFFIGALLVDLELEPDAPFEHDRCGTCTRCLDACPTKAFPAPRELDASRCISYLTIELRAAIPEELRQPIGGNLYGCDVCQDVCPWNVRFASAVREPAFGARAVIGDHDARALAREILLMTDETYAAAFKGSAMKRAKLRGLKRNAAVVLGNVGTPDDVDVLQSVTGDPVVQQHLDWAQAQISSRSSRDA